MTLKIATFDIEGNNLYPAVDKVWCAAVKDHDTGAVTQFDPNHIHELPDFLDKYDCLIGHNSISYDFPTLRKLFNWEFKGQKIDTLLMSRTQRPDRILPPHCKNKKAGPHSVEAWGYRLGRGKVANDEWDHYTPILLIRCVEDVEIQYLIYKALLKEGEGEGWERAHKLNAKLFHYLQLQEDFGWLVDREHLENCLHMLDRWIAKIDASIEHRLPVIVEVDETKKAGEYGYVKRPFKKDGTYSIPAQAFVDAFGMPVVGPFSRVSFRKVDLDSNAEVKDFLLASGWEPDEWNTNNVGERTSPKLSKNDSFEGIQGSLGRLVARRIQCRQRKGVIEGWRDSIRADGRISTATSGMASTGRIKHRGLVNVPSPHSKAFFAGWMRKLFIARPGWVLVGADSAGNQIRQLAARMGDQEFTAAVLYGNSKEGTDLHSLNQKRTGVASRNLAKNFFYGFLFGAGDAKIGKIIGGNSAAGKALKAEYLNKMPKLKALLDRMTEEWRKTAQKWFNPKYNRIEYRNGYITGLDGRPIFVESEHAILVYFLQSDEAIQMATAYVMFHKWMEERGYVYGQDYGAVIWYHDEIQIECREELAQTVAELLCEAIKWAGEYYRIQCPHAGESKVGRSWYDTH